MVLLILMNIIGILTYFLLRYDGRTDKVKPLSFRFWIKDNWVQLSIIFLINSSVMILLLSADLTIDKIPFIPEWFTSYGDATITWGIGLLLSHPLYVGVKKAMKF